MKYYFNVEQVNTYYIGLHPTSEKVKGEAKSQVVTTTLYEYDSQSSSSPQFIINGATYINEHNETIHLFNGSVLFEKGAIQFIASIDILHLEINETYKFKIISGNGIYLFSKGVIKFIRKDTNIIDVIICLR